MSDNKTPSTITVWPHASEAAEYIVSSAGVSYVARALSYQDDVTVYECVDTVTGQSMGFIAKVAGCAGPLSCDTQTAVARARQVVATQKHTTIQKIKKFILGRKLWQK